MFRRKNFGIKVRDGKRNRGHFYAHDVEVFKDEFLEKVLKWKPLNHKPIYELLREHKIKLVMEPGRSLLDQTGITISRVKGLKNSSQGDLLLLCDMNISHLWDQVIGSEFAVDPILIPHPKNMGINEEAVECHIVGNLCLESDVLAWRRIRFSRKPMEGDLLVFVNRGKVLRLNQKIFK